VGGMRTMRSRVFLNWPHADERQKQSRKSKLIYQNRMQSIAPPGNVDLIMHLCSVPREANQVQNDAWRLLLVSARTAPFRSAFNVLERLPPSQLGLERPPDRHV